MSSVRKCLLILSLLSLFSRIGMGQNYSTTNIWQTAFPDVGTFSSPRLTDLNGDNTLDIILGAGRKEFHACDTAVIALDGKTGDLLWHVSARDQIFGTATLADITGDGIDDVFICGRSAELMAINGATGEVIWRFLAGKNLNEIRALKWYNFYTPQLIEDLSGDGIGDLLVANGGDVLAEPFDTNRPPGYLLVIDAATSGVLHKAEMPDGKEIYMSAIADDIDGDGILDIIYGTGGETTGGHLYRTDLPSLRKNQLDKSVVLATGPAKGFIAPPALADLDKDGVRDIICNSVDGRVMAFDGRDNSPLWGGNIPGCEGYASLAIADINSDSYPDVFTDFAQGVWPDLKAVRPLLISGKDGQVIFVDSIGFYQMSSPVIADLNGDTHPEGILSVNFFLPNAAGEKTIHNSLLAYDFKNRGKFALAPPQVGSNVGSTPWVGDMDNNGLMDIIYVQMTTPDHVYTYDGIRVIRLESKMKSDKVFWGGYMGTKGTGVEGH